jgi:asparagine synthase (glutamine-hydrolysing)
MLERVSYRGDTTALHVGAGLILGLRHWKSRAEGVLGAVPGGDLGLAGTLTALIGQEAGARSTLSALQERSVLDGAFGAAWTEADGSRLTLMRDPFGARSLYYFVASNAVYFASELKQLLAIPECSREVDLVAIHKYLTFSFVPGEAVPIKGVKRVLAGHAATFAAANVPRHEPYFVLQEQENETYRDRTVAIEALRNIAKDAVTASVSHGNPVALYLSGGLDSAAMAVWLKSRGTDTTLLTLDFGAQNVERDEARAVADAVGFKHVLVPMNGAELKARIPALAAMLDLPFGDSVTGPQMMLGIAAETHGLSYVLNGEGGDQLFGGWTHKPMIAAEIYGGVVAGVEESREETSLRSYHRFYGMEDALYTDAFRTAVGGAGQRRAHLAPYLTDANGISLLGRVRLADLALKGSQNILPRAERIAAGLGLSMAAPLFNRRLAEFSFQLPSEMKLSGACEKYVLKLAMQGRLPEDVIWRKKSGMSVPMTDWLMGPLRDVMEEYVGDRAVGARGWFRKEAVAALRDGKDQPSETRKRRIGEKLWALIMLEAWVRHVVEGRSL